VIVDSLHPDIDRTFARLLGIVARRSHHRIAEDQPALVVRAIDRVVAAS
jgi:hypothetical protein